MSRIGAIESSYQRTPHMPCIAARNSVWATPFSLAATQGISIDFSSSPYSDASLRVVRPPLPKQGSVLAHRIPIRVSLDQRLHAPTQGLSQLATPFITPQAEPFTKRRLRTSNPGTYAAMHGDNRE